MSSAMQKLSAAAETTGLSFDRERNILYGTFGNYAFAVLVNASNVRYCSILFHVTRDGNPFTANDGKEIAKESNKLLQFAKPSGAPPVVLLGQVYDMGGVGPHLHPPVVGDGVPGGVCVAFEAGEGQTGSC